MRRCAITDGTAGSRPGWLVQRCAQLAAEGLDLLILRERELAPADLVAFARRVVAEAASTRVLLAAPPRLALAAGAAGAHLSTRPGECTPAQVRAVLPTACITQSCHTLEEVRRARAQQVDAILFGPLFGKWVGTAEVVRGIGLDRLNEAVAEAGDVPVYALGGITPANAPLCQSAGIAAIRMFFS